MKENLVKARQELNLEKKKNLRTKTKLDSARKMTEQRMANTLASSSPDPQAMDQDELASLYSTLIDEDSFELGEGDVISNPSELLQNVEDEIKNNYSDNEQERLLLKLSDVRNKTLEKVKSKKVEGRGRRDSISSVGSTGSRRMKRNNSDDAGGESTRQKINSSSSNSI